MMTSTWAKISQVKLPFTPISANRRSIAAVIDELHQQFPNVPELGMDVDEFMEGAKK
ncbi:pyrroloquinoline quinone biosynthesis protein PqqD, partial [Pseudomonas syringae pv. japonica str. M301072]